MTTPKVLDSSAILAYLEDEPGALTVQKLFHEAGDTGASIYVSVINWGEVYYLCLRKSREKAEEMVQFLDGLPIIIVNVDRDLTQLAAEIKSEGKISYADCFAAALAKINGAALVTRDKEFRRLEGFIKILWI